MGFRGDEKLNEMEAGVGVGIEDGLAVGEWLYSSGCGPLYNEPMLEKR
jgi:hypothetical protein